MSKKEGPILILDNIRSAENVGSIFRTADAVGVNEIYLCGVTPTPVDRFGREFTKFTKASLGAHNSIKWKKYEKTLSAVRVAQKKGFIVLALEQSPGSVPYDMWKEKKNFALVVGNEVEGVNPPVLKAVDAIIEIPMKGMKESLNVSVATGIALFELLK
jgi:23S rRNA (guanosine2251-2'-O)-methyltransferase